MEIRVLCLKHLQKVTEECKPVLIDLLHRCHASTANTENVCSRPPYFICVAFRKVRAAGTLGSMFSLHTFEGIGSCTSGY